MQFTEKDGTPIEVIYGPIKPLDTPDSNVAPFTPRQVLLEKAYVHEPGRRPLEADLLWGQDVALSLRDGTVIYADVFRPTDGAPAPTILVWTPYGKRDGWWKANIPLERVGIPREAVSGLQNFESPDPAWWAARGYAVFMVDARGSTHSGGDLKFWGREAGRDVGDAIEWAAAQPWSNGRIGMSGNSQLGIMQWFAAAEQPPHLAAIAPWEGLTDMYRDNMAKGGIPTPEFQRDEVSSRNYGLNRMELPADMIERYLLINAYWADKRVRLDRIELPVYAVASYSDTLHSRGTLAAFAGIASTEKWLRIHNTMEWPDLYQQENVEDLKRFFDRYLAGEDNGWEDTPRVRLSLLDPGGADEIGRPDTSWPPAAMRPVQFHLDANTGSLSQQAPDAGAARYAVDEPEPQALFRLNILEDTGIAGPIGLKLWVETEGCDDMDISVQLYKTGVDGAKSYHICLPGSAGEALKGLLAQGKAPGLLTYGGPQGRLRVSHRDVDPALSTELEPFHRHDRRRPLSPGEVAEIDIDIWPVGLKLHPGETCSSRYRARPSTLSDCPECPTVWCRWPGTQARV